MRIPNRHIAKPKEEPKQAPAIVERVVEAKADSTAILAEVKKVLDVKQKPVKYVFSILRDEDGLMTQVIANPVDAGTII